MLTARSQINSFYGLGQFQERFGKPVPGKPGTFAITASWQSGLSNSSVVGQLVGLLINSYTQDRFGCRPTMVCSFPESNPLSEAVC